MLAAVIVIAAVFFFSHLQANLPGQSSLGPDVLALRLPASLLLHAPL